MEAISNRGNKFPTINEQQRCCIRPPTKVGGKKVQIERPALVPASFLQLAILENLIREPADVNNKYQRRKIDEDREGVSGHAVEGKTLLWLHRC